MTPRGKGPATGLLIIAHPSASGSPDSGPRLSSPESEPDADDMQQTTGAAGETCDACRFMADDGRCLRFPPICGDWARVNPDDYCGFFERGPKRQTGGGQPEAQTQEPKYQQ